MSKANTQPLPTINPIRDEIDRWTFIACVLFGAAAIVTLREMGIPSILVMYIPTGLILFYLVVVIYMKRLRIFDGGD